MSFSNFWLLPAVALLGLALVAGLYGGAKSGLPPRSRGALSLLSGAAWLGLAGLLSGPFLVSRHAVFHAPSVVLALDVSASYASQSGEARRLAEEVRRHYATLGFDVLEFAFGEKAFLAGEKIETGRLTGVSDLRRRLDSLDLPNLQAVFLFTDGRFNLDEGASDAGFGPAPVFPVLTPNTMAEAQGEKVVVGADSDDSGDVTVEWRPLGGLSRATVELESEGKSFWRGTLASSGVVSGAVQRQRFRLPPRLAHVLGAAKTLRALIRPEGANAVADNDSLEARVAGPKSRHFFVRPIQFLEERGLMDALIAAESLQVRALAPDSLSGAGLRSGDMLWARASSPAEATARAAASRFSVPIVLYRLPESKGAGRLRFRADARVSWDGDMAPFLPPAVLRLADLGMTDSLELTLADSITGLAWADDSGRRGLLVGREKGPGAPVFRMTVLPLWKAAFRPDADERIVRLQRQWAQGVAARALRAGKTAPGSDTARTRTPAVLEMSRLGADVERLSALAVFTHGSLVRADAQTFSGWPDLPRGQTREEKNRSRPVLPEYLAACIVAALFCGAWALRKRFHLD